METNEAVNMAASGDSESDDLDRIIVKLRTCVWGIVVSKYVRVRPADDEAPRTICRMVSGGTAHAGAQVRISCLTSCESDEFSLFHRQPHAPVAALPVLKLAHQDSVAFKTVVQRMRAPPVLFATLVDDHSAIEAHAALPHSRGSAVV